VNPKSEKQFEIKCEIGGVDPAVIRELSGVYKPFPKAFKELISNAYDADAESVRIQLSDNVEQIEVIDDGIGMTPFEFQNEFTRLGGSHKRLGGGVTTKGRRRIGSKGIGFLAVARYCSGIEVVSTTLRKHRGKIQYDGQATTIDLSRFLDVKIPHELLAKRLKVTAVAVTFKDKSRRLSADEFELAYGRQLRIRRKGKASPARRVQVWYSLDCRNLEFKAVIDFDYLLSLENKRDLSQVSDFYALEVYSIDKNDERLKQQYTKISLIGLKDFVQRDLKVPKRPGRVRNIESQSGLDKFLWHLSRCTPIKYDLPKSLQQMFGEDILKSKEINAIDSALVSGSGFEVTLRRPLWAGDPDREWLPTEAISIPVRIEQEGLRARGYILGHREAIFPAEYRGISVRVRNVQIGAPGFFGLEQTLSGPSRVMLSQITGEINVFEGLDATDSLNPGRDSFYEENSHYKILRKSIVGDGEAATGLLGTVIKGLLERLQVLSAIESNLSRANHYRSALVNLSMAINHYGTNSNGGVDLRGLFAKPLSANGLSERENFDILPGPRVAGFRVNSQSEPERERFVDFDSKTVYFDFKHDRWSNRIFLLGQHYEVVPKMGRNNDPLCEIDTIEKKVYVNWGHPLRQQMGDVAFLKSAVVWKLSFHACQGNIEAMMDLALNLLTFNGA